MPEAHFLFYAMAGTATSVVSKNVRMRHHSRRASPDHYFLFRHHPQLVANTQGKIANDPTVPAATTSSFRTHEVCAA